MSRHERELIERKEESVGLGKRKYPSRLEQGEERSAGSGQMSTSYFHVSEPRLKFKTPTAAATSFLKTPFLG